MGTVTGIEDNDDGKLDRSSSALPSRKHIANPVVYTSTLLYECILEKHRYCHRTIALQPRQLCLLLHNNIQNERKTVNQNQRPWNSEFDVECVLGFLGQKARPLFRDRKRFAQMIDPLLEGQFPVRGLYQALAIAAMCVQEQPNMRPAIADVVTALNYLASQKYEHHLHSAQCSRNSISSPRMRRDGHRYDVSSDSETDKSVS